MECPHCKEKIAEDAKFCPICGTKIERKELPLEAAPVIDVDLKPEAPAPKKKPWGIIAAAVAGVAVVGAAAVLFLNMDRRNPKTVIFDAFRTVYSSEEEKPLENIFGFRELFNNSKESSMEYGLGLNFDKDYVFGLTSLEGIGIRLEEKNNVETGQGSCDIGLRYMGMNLAKLKMYYDDKTFMASVPDLGDTVYTLNYADDLEGQLEKSPFLGDELLKSGVNPQGIVDYIDYCMELSKGNNIPFDLPGLKKRYEESDALDSFKDSIKVSKLSDKKEFKVDGKKQKCRGFEMIVAKDSLIKFLEDSSEFVLQDQVLKEEMIKYYGDVLSVTSGMTTSSYIYGDSSDISGESIVNEMWESIDQSMEELIQLMDGALEDEITLKVYVDKKGRLICVDGETEMTNESGEKGTMMIQAEMKGGSYLTQNMTASLIADWDGAESGLAYTKEGTGNEVEITSDAELEILSDSQNITLTFSGTYDQKNRDYSLSFNCKLPSIGSVKVSVDGSVEDFEKGKSFEATADSILVSTGGIDLFKLSGNYSIMPLEDEIEALEGKQMDILSATQEDWEQVITEMQNKLTSLFLNF